MQTWQLPVVRKRGEVMALTYEQQCQRLFRLIAALPQQLRFLTRGLVALGNHTTYYKAHRYKGRRVVVTAGRVESDGTLRLYVEGSSEVMKAFFTEMQTHIDRLHAPGAIHLADRFVTLTGPNVFTTGRASVDITIQ